MDDTGGHGERYHIQYNLNISQHRYRSIHRVFRIVRVYRQWLPISISVYTEVSKSSLRDQYNQNLTIFKWRATEKHNNVGLSKLKSVSLSFFCLSSHEDRKKTAGDCTWRSVLFKLFSGIMRLKLLSACRWPLTTSFSNLAHNCSRTGFERGHAVNTYRRAAKCRKSSVLSKVTSPIL